jgi:cobalamin biosynthesis Mg chelatase CobN
MIWRNEPVADAGHMLITHFDWQAMKSQIIEQLGQSDILLPSLVTEGLAANDRIKVRMSALQAAAHHAQQPDHPATDLHVECRAAGIAPAALATLIGGAHLAGEGRIAAPNLARLMKEVHDDVTAMIRAVAAGKPSEGETMSARLAAIRAAGVLEASNDIEIARVAKLTGVAQDGADSLHRLVMDLHKALNRLATDCSEEILAGAHVFGLHPEDRAVVESFMQGVNETRALKFNHPGLDTMATRSGGRLLIQNDIGTTDAHVVVIAVTKNTVTVTYTDVHRARAKFFIALFDKFQVKWSGLDRQTAEGLGDDSAFFLVTGQYEAESSGDRNAFLTSLGATLVFLIDWNKARKLLRSWLPKDDAVRILEWAARQRFGHRAFLELGGNELIGAAVRNAAPVRIGFGERLDQALGRNAAIDFLKTAIRVSTEALRAGQSIRLVRDQIEADLIRHLERVDSALLAIVIRQVGLAHDLAAAISEHIATLQAGRPADGKLLAARAGQIERKADRIAFEARKEADRLNAGSIIEQLVDRVEESVDELEQAAFIASLAPAGIDPALVSALAELCAVATTATEAAASGLAAAVEVPEGRRADSEDALAAVVRLIDAEHAADMRERDVTARVFAGGFDVATSLCVLELARAIERATDRLAGFGHLLRRHIMADLST